MESATETNQAAADQAKDAPEKHVSGAVEEGMQDMLAQRVDHTEAMKRARARSQASATAASSSQQSEYSHFDSHGGRERDEEALARAWLTSMERAGIPPRFQRAHFKNCERYSNDRGKQKALGRARSFCEDGHLLARGQRRFCLLLTGDFGTGKTWLATAAFKNMLYTQKSKQGLWRKFYAFIREVQGTYSAAAERSVDAVLGAYQHTDLLMLDDLGDLDRPVQSDDRRRLVYEVLDARNDQLKPTIITTNLNVDEMADQFGERTFQRLMEMCAMVEMQGVNLRENAA